jgi:hypothetical protein
MAIAADHVVAASGLGWLKGHVFDVNLIFGLTLLSLMAGGVIAVYPGSFGVLLLCDNWLLGFPHVVATFTRLVPDRPSVARHWFLIFVLPLIVVAATSGLVAWMGVWIIATIYFYWQWFHTVRQGWGVAKLFRRSAKGSVVESEPFDEFLFYLVPAWGLLHQLCLGPDHFLFPSVKIIVPPIPAIVGEAVGVAAVVGLAWWGLQRCREALAGTLPVLHTAFALSHFTIFIVGYVVMDGMAGGWVVTNIWHTGQYLMLVWMFNENTGLRHGRRSSAFLVLTGGNRIWRYLALCFIVALPVYIAITWGINAGASAATIAIILNQTLNFHHFIVDGVIWRSRRQPAGAPV